MSDRQFKAVFDVLFSVYGKQDWWPAETLFEVMVGAVLSQNTAWANVEKAINQLREANALAAENILALDHDALAQLIRPSGYFNVKARRLRNFVEWFQQQGGFDALSAWSTDDLRAGLLSVNGVGKETADDMLLYAFGRPVFIIDTYTRRLFSRLGVIAGDEEYDVLRGRIEAALGPDQQMFNEYHALIVNLAKDYCRVKPLCADCPLSEFCEYSIQ